jgi:glycosyltransferase involved in cell wall biosynthesis
MTTPKLSVIVIGYNMARELPRTIRTLSSQYQRDIAAEDYEIIVIDNGSSQPFDGDALCQLGTNIQVQVFTATSSSPVPAINYGLSLARGELVGVCIDGARMASPRLLATALEAARLHPRPVIGTLAFHLGPDLQKRSVARGYCQTVEDALLESVDWCADGYRLFSISVLAGSSANGWFCIPSESNAIFLTRAHWQALGGYDPAFVSPGGGLVNLDTWARACADPDGQIILLLGEATFHQVHGGIATNSVVSKWPQFHDEYVRIRGCRYAAPQGIPLLAGRLRPEALPSLHMSAARALHLASKNPT